MVTNRKWLVFYQKGAFTASDVPWLQSSGDRSYKVVLHSMEDESENEVRDDIGSLLEE